MNHSLELIGELTAVEVIAAGVAVRDLRRLRRAYGSGHWRKLKGIAQVRLPDGVIAVAEVHWYEAHGVGRRDFKVKRLLS